MNACTWLDEPQSHCESLGFGGGANSPTSAPNTPQAKRLYPEKRERNFGKRKLRLKRLA